MINYLSKNGVRVCVYIYTHFLLQTNNVNIGACAIRVFVILFTCMFALLQWTREQEKLFLFRMKNKFNSTLKWRSTTGKDNTCGCQIFVIITRTDTP